MMTASRTRGGAGPAATWPDSYTVRYATITLVGFVDRRGGWHGRDRLRPAGRDRRRVGRDQRRPPQRLVARPMAGDRSRVRGPGRPVHRDAEAGPPQAIAERYASFDRREAPTPAARRPRVHASSATGGLAILL